jgi:hypothetical protein
VAPSVKTIRTRPETRRGPTRRRSVAARPAADVGVLAAEQRLRSSGGPDDRARYHCACGLAFLAPVSTTVGCPHCGTRQSW